MLRTPLLLVLVLSLPAAAGDADDAARVLRQLEKDTTNIEKESMAQLKAARERAAKKLAALRDRLTKAGRYDDALELHAQVKALRAVCVKIEWNGSWYAGSIVATRAGQHRVHYDGYGASSDEWVPVSRVVEQPCALPAAAEPPPPHAPAE